MAALGVVRCCERRGTARFVVGESPGKRHELTCPGGLGAGSHGGLPVTLGAATVSSQCAGPATSPAASSGSPEPVAMAGTDRADAARARACRAWRPRRGPRVAVASAMGLLPPDRGLRIKTPPGARIAVAEAIPAY